MLPLEVRIMDVDNAIKKMLGEDEKKEEKEAEED